MSQLRVGQQLACPFQATHLWYDYEPCSLHMPAPLRMLCHRVSCSRMSNVVMHAPNCRKNRDVAITFVAIVPVVQFSYPACANRRVPQVCQQRARLLHAFDRAMSYADTLCDII
jgi:hypothetical protein